jgi:hypothetical protein
MNCSIWAKVNSADKVIFESQFILMQSLVNTPPFFLFIFDVAWIIGGYVFGLGPNLEHKEDDHLSVAIIYEI